MKGVHINTLMEIFNIICGLASLISLILTCCTYQKVKKIYNNIGNNTINNNSIKQVNKSNMHKSTITQTGINISNNKVNGKNKG